MDELQPGQDEKHQYLTFEYDLGIELSKWISCMTILSLRITSMHDKDMGRTRTPDGRAGIHTIYTHAHTYTHRQSGD